MLKSTLLLIFLSFCLGTGVWLFFLYAVKKGEFDDIEGAKYRMLEDDDLEPGPPVPEQTESDPQNGPRRASPGAPGAGLKDPTSRIGDDR